MNIPRTFLGGVKKKKKHAEQKQNHIFITYQVYKELDNMVHLSHILPVSIEEAAATTKNVLFV